MQSLEDTQDALNESRIFERFSARFPVKFKDTRDEFGTMVFLRDASAEGFRVTTRERLYVHDSVALEVKLPDGFEPLSLNGRVIWVKQKEQYLWEAGVQLHKPHLLELHRLYRLVTQQPQSA